MAIKHQVRTNKDGTLTYYTRVPLPNHPETGQRRRESISAPSLQRLEDLYWEVRNAANAGSYVLRKETITVGELASRWLPIYAGKVEKQTWTFTELVVRRNILPFCGRRPLRELTSLDIEDWYRWLRDEHGLSTGSISRRRDVFSALLDAGIGWNFVAVNVVRKAKPPKVTKRPIRYLTFAESEALIAEAAGSHLEPLLVLALGTGMRLGELIALTWSNVNLAAGRITVAASVGEANTSRRYTKGPKTAAGRRVLPITPDLVAYLRTQKHGDDVHRRADPRWNPDRLVLPGERGGWLWPSNVRRALKAIAAAAGLPVDLRPHELRHTHAALLILGGYPMKAIQHRLGHASIKVTMDIYGFIHEEVAESVSAVLPGLVPGASRDEAAAGVIDLSKRIDRQKKWAHEGHMEGFPPTENVGNERKK